MRALLPHPSDTVDVVAAYAPSLRGGTDPFVRCNMISSVDGAIAHKGRSGALGGPGDRRVFQVLRSWADVIVVGAGTARAEGYGPARLDDGLRAARTARGQPPVPPIAVVTLSGRLDLASSFFCDAEARPFVVTAEGPGEETLRRNGRLADLADVVVAGTGTVDLGGAFEQLARHQGAGASVLVEGGPSLNADVVRAGLLDELCLTVSPRLVGGGGPRVVAGDELDPPVGIELVQLLEEDGFFFYRLAVSGSSAMRSAAGRGRPRADPPTGGLGGQSSKGWSAADAGGPELKDVNLCAR